MAKDRLQKVVARAGIASRRAAEDLISKGRVRVNGVVVTTLGTKVDARADKVEVDGRRRLVAPFPGPLATRIGDGVDDVKGEALAVVLHPGRCVADE